jgi:hypothetical protein
MRPEGLTSGLSCSFADTVTERRPSRLAAANCV